MFQPKRIYSILFSLFLLTPQIGCTTFFSKPKSLPKKFVLGLDGIGYDTFQAMQRGGYFRNFEPVVPMVATFPSISDPNWTLLMNAKKTASYTKAHIDLSIHPSSGGVGELMGSLVDHLKTPQPYEEIFNFKPEGFFEHLVSIAWADTSSFYWLDAIENDFFDTVQTETYSAFIVNTDIISHTRGEQEVFTYLARVDESLKRMQKKYLEKTGKVLEMWLISDHGNAFLTPKFIEFETGLQAKGFQLKLPLKEEKDVGFFAPEIISFGAFFCFEKTKESLAKALSETEGVHVSAFVNEKNEVMVYSQKGKSVSKIGVDPVNKKASLTVIKGENPFHNQDYFKGGSLSFDQYFDKTLKEDYPFAAVRLWQAFFEVTEAPASVLVSPQLGYAFSNKTLELITALKGLKSTHGSLHKKETLGIVASTHHELSAIRPEQMRALIKFTPTHQHLLHK